MLEWKGVRRDPMPPGRWTALFFLDEATALSAGHRPCAYCRRAAFNSFAEAWRRARRTEEKPRAFEIDAVLHTERVDRRTRSKRTARMPASRLPDGAMFLLSPGPALVLNGTALPWSFSGYGPPQRLPVGDVEVLTPPSSVAALAAGYRPVLHPSAADRRPG